MPLKSKFFITCDICGEEKEIHLRDLGVEEFRNFKERVY